jgi:hypothetical protein
MENFQLQARLMKLELENKYQGFELDPNSGRMVPKEIPEQRAVVGKPPESFVTTKSEDDIPF